MKVKVSYSMDIEEIPDLIDGLLAGCRQKMTSELDNLKSSLYDTPKMMKQMDKVRATLSLVDSQLEDVVGLVAGWDQATSIPDEEEEGPPLVETDEETS